MNLLDHERAFRDMEKMLYKLAWTYHKTYNLDFNECLSECHWAFVKAVNWRWNPKKGTKLSTTVYTIAQWRLKNLRIAKMRQPQLLEINEEIVGAAPETRSEALEIAEGLSEDAREIVELLVNTPAELLRDAPVPLNHLVSRVKRHLAKKGRNKTRLEKAHREIVQCFQAAWA